MSGFEVVDIDSQQPDLGLVNVPTTSSDGAVGPTSAAASSSTAGGLHSTANSSTKSSASTEGISRVEKQKSDKVQTAYSGCGQKQQTLSMAIGMRHT